MISSTSLTSFAGHSKLLNFAPRVASTLGAARNLPDVRFGAETAGYTKILLILDC